MKAFLSVMTDWLLVPVLAKAEIYRLAEMNTGQIRRLDRNKTAVLLPGGILEQLRHPRSRSAQPQSCARPGR
jgi:hypothetical protein